MVDLYPTLPQGRGVGVTSFALSFVREIAIGLLREPEMCSLQLGEDPEDQNLHMHENVKWLQQQHSSGCHGIAAHSWNLLVQGLWQCFSCTTGERAYAGDHGSLQ